MEVRRIRVGEGAALREIRLRALADAPTAFASTYADEAGRDPATWDGAAARRADGDREASFVAVDERGSVGLVGAFRSEQDDALVELVSMWTAPEARREGIGAALVDAVVAWAASIDAAQVGLWVTRGNDAAYRLYERMGFTPTGDYQPLPSDPCKDEIRMQRRA